MTSHPNLTAASVSLLAGAFLFTQFVDAQATGGWPLYFASFFLAALSLTTCFPKEKWTVIASLGLTPGFVVTARTAFQLWRDPTCCNLAPPYIFLLLLLGWPAPLLGYAASLLFRRIPAARSASTGLGLATLASAFFFPHIKHAQFTNQWQSAATACLTDRARPHELYMDVCSGHDQFDAVLSCQNQFRSQSRAYEISQAGREAVNTFMHQRKPATCQ